MKRLEFQIYRILPAALLLVAVFALFSAPAAAVPNFATDTGQDINITRAWSADFVDVDADGDLDYIMGGDTINIEVYRNNGGYNFTQIDDVGDNAYAIAAGDVDGDGDADFAAGHNSFAVNTVWLNDGAGAFTDSTQSIDVNAFDETRDLVLGDVDGDGDLDIAYGNLGEPNYVWLNDGSGIFTDTLQSIDVGTSDLTKSLILSDVDGDGDPDMIYGNLGEPNYVLLNDGTGDFTDSGQAMGTDVTEDVLTADVDGDGDLDILEGVYSVANSLWKNDGAGSFTLTWQSSGYTNDTNSLAAADLDHDGDIDFVAGNNNGLPTVWDNDSTGLFSYVMELEDGCPPLFTNQIHAVDLSGDGAPDVVVTNGGLIGPNCKRTDYIFPNTSTGSNTAPNAQTITAEPDYLTWLNVTDTITLEWNTGSDTETSDPDLLTYDVRLGTSSSGNETFGGDFFSSGRFGNVGATTTYTIVLETDTTMTYFWSAATVDTGKRQGAWAVEDSFVVAPAFEDSGQSLGTGNVNSVYGADVDGDGDIDAILGQGSSQGEKVWTNNGIGTFTDSLQTLSNKDTFSIVVADIDGDGDMDLISGNYAGGQADEVFTNNGSGTFTNTAQALGTTNTWSVTAADVDMDGDIDFFSLDYINSQGAVLWLNNGTGTFSYSGQSLGSGICTSVKTADLDADGDIDLVKGIWDISEVWRNDGSGTFAITTQGAIPARTTYSDILVDVDGDGYIDIIEGNYGQGNTVYSNNGTGTFSNTGQSLGTYDTRFIAGADLDGDGDVDFVEGNKNGQANKVWLNNGSGVYSDSGISMGANNTQGIFTADLDGDGDIDFIEGTASGAPTKIWINNVDHANTTPVAPTLTDETDSGVWDTTTAVTLDWSAGSDAETTDADLLTYDVRIGTAPTTCDVYCGFFPSIGTTPFLSAVFGNAGVTTSHNIDLPVGTYYWTARTVDATLERSSFPAVDSFTLRPAFEVTAQALGGGTDSRVSRTADVDGDGDIDIIESNFGGGGQNNIWMNDGSGTFSQNSPAGDAYGSQGIAPADIDGDGDIDYMEAGFGFGNVVFLNNGSGTFTNSGLSLGADATWSVAAGDIDGDGDIDFFEGTADTISNKLWLNDGDGDFTDSGLAINTDYVIDSYMLDLDSDGDTDIAYSVALSGSRVVLNDGDVTFTDSGMSMNPSNSRGMAIGDFDADGFMDLYFTDMSGGGDYIWTNDGDGTFTNTQTIGSEIVSWAFAADFDGDGDTDVAAAVKGGAKDNRIWLNTGGTLADSGLGMGANSSWLVTGADFDGDGDVDLFEANQGASNRVWRNNMDHANTAPVAPTALVAEPDYGPVLPWSNVTLQWTPGSDAETTDADLLTYDVCIGTASGDCDVFGGSFPYTGTTPYRSSIPGNAGATTTHSISLNPSVPTTYYWTARTVDVTNKAGAWTAEDSFTITPAFEDSGEVLGNINARRSDVADVDGDGDIDVIIACSVCANKVWLNDGAGAFSDSGQNNGGSGTQAATAGDLDGDGDMDYIESTWDNQAERVWKNNGSGNFTYFGQTAQLHYGGSGALGDVDGDGDLDYFENNQNTDPELLWLNNGNGSFTVSGTNFGTYSGVWTEMADVDDDGDLDMALSFGNAMDELWMNDGSGTFTNAGAIGLAATSFVVATDVDGDRDVDILFLYSAGPSELWTNDGAGNFTDSGQSLPGLSFSVEGDYDGDGDIDIFYRDGATSYLKMLLNDGTGTFSDSGFSLPITGAILPRAADFNADGDLDIFFSRQNKDNLVLVNNMDHAQTTPVAPTLTAEADSFYWTDNTVTLDWAAGSDAETTDADLLTYDVRIGTAPDTCDVFCGFFPSSGTTPFLSAMFGNAGATTSLHIGLTPTTITGYYWTARTVDATKERSSFPATDYFTVAPAFEDSGQTIGIAANSPLILDAADVDGDGDQDILVGNTGAANEVWMNNGSGVFADSGQSLGGANQTRGWDAVDVDGDGDLDILEASDGGTAGKVYTNDGSGTFTDTVQSLGGGNSKASFGADLDMDGDIDMYVGNFAQTGGVFLNDGSGTFTWTGVNYTGYNTQSVVGADVDDDGDIDVIEGNWSSADRVWTNDGTASFTLSAEALGTYSTYCIKYVDVDGDGDGDIIESNWNFEPDRIYTNDGSGAFTDTGQSLGSDKTIFVSAGDLDNDGDIDFISVSSVDTDPNRIYLNNGSGTFSDSGFSAYIATMSSLLVDVDGDDDLDIIFGNDTDVANQVWINNLNPANTAPAAPALTAEADIFTWTNATETVTLKWAAGSDAETTDADLLTYDVRIGTAPDTCDVFCGFFPSSGTTPFLSAVFGNAGATTSHAITLSQSQTTVYYWSVRTVDATLKSSAWDTVDNFKVTPAFEDSGQTLGSFSTTGLDAADVDGDGDFDIIAGNYSGQANRVYINDGTGSFTDSGSSYGAVSTHDTEAADLDGDGDIDFIANNYSTASKIYINNGAGVFSVGQTLTYSGTSSRAHAADLDGDGDIDYVQARLAAADRVWINDGSATFTDSGQSLGGGGDVTRALSTADIDKDGDLDLFTGYMSGSRLFLNDGSGNFTDTSQPIAAGEIIREAPFVDVDGDGDFDIIPAITTNPTEVWLNNGAGTFSDSGQSLGTSSTRSMSAADLDGDGDIDFAEGNSSSSNSIWLNDGSGSFSDSGLALGSALVTYRLDIADVDGDGDLDILEAVFSSTPNRIYRNNINHAQTAPVAPALTAEPDAFYWGAATDLKWTAGSDAETAAILLTYDLCVGTTSGDCNVYGGFFTYNVPTPYISAEFGNAGATTTYFIDLAPTTLTTYYWSARTVDATVKSSAWDTEDSFTLEPAFEDSGETIGSSQTGDIAMVDVEGDGDLDMISVNYSYQANKVWLNNGSGSFSDSGASIGAQASVDVSPADLDNDGDIDFIEQNYDSSSRVYLNNGSGSFSAGQALTYSTTMDGGHVADLDSDGDFDYVQGYLGTSDKIWLNNGSAAFTDSGQALVGASVQTRRIKTSDVDGDGDTDIFIGYNTGAKVFENDGSGDFTDTGQPPIAAAEYVVGAAFADIDGDKDADLILSNYGGQNSVWLNDGAGVFSDSGQSFDPDWTSLVATGDLDGDGDIDFCIGNGGQDYIFLNDGSGVFSDSGVQLGDSSATQGLAAVDVDADGDLDIAVGRAVNIPNKIFINNLDHAQTAPVAPTLTAEPDIFRWDNAAETVTLQWTAGSDAETAANLLTYDVCLGTTSGDCDVYGGLFPGTPNYLSAMFGNSGATTSYHIALNPDVTTTYYWSARTVDATIKSSAWDTEDSFTITPAFEQVQGLGTSNSRRSAIADVDGDGDFDIIESCSVCANKVWTNDGAGTFSDSGESMGTYTSQDVTTADVDGDGDIDIVETTWGAQGGRVWMNNGSGAFSYAGQIPGTYNSRFGSLADIDADGDIDYIESANTAEPNKVWVNNGSGTYSDSGNTLGTGVLLNTDVGDVDNDGDNDIVGAGGSTTAFLWLNDGTGAFTDSGQLTGDAPNTSHIIFADMDGDGNLDVFAAGGASELWINDGTGTLIDPGQSEPGLYYCNAGDLDGDGDIDLMGTTSVVLNDGAGNLTDPGLTLTSPSALSVDLADFDGDGDLDATTGNQNTANLVFRNNTNTANTMPAQPTPIVEPDVGTSVVTAGVRLQWGAGGDTETSDADLLTYDVKLGTTSGGCDVYCGLFPGGTPWLGAGFGNAGATGGLYINLGHGQYFWSVRTVDATLKPSAWSAEDSFFVDATLPTTVASVYDGPQTGVDFTYASSTTQLSASWTDSSDPETGIARYWYAIGTTAGATDVVTWTDNGTATSVTKTGLTLTEAATYYFTVRAENGVATLGTAANSDGQLIDVTPPAITSVTTADTEPDGYLNTVTFNFDDTLVGSNEVADWTITDGDAATNLLTGILDAGVSVSGTTVTITLANNTGTTGPVTYTYSQAGADNLRDAAGNPVAIVGATTSSDNAAPVFMSSVSDNQIDANNLPAGTMITITFSEDVNITPAQVDAADWTVTNGSWHGGATVNYADGAGYTMTATLSSGTTSNDWNPATPPTMDRSAGALTNANSIEDGVGNDAVANASADEIITGTCAPVSSIDSITPGTGSACQFISATATLYYNNNPTCSGGSGDFSVIVSASDVNSGIQKVIFPATVSAGATDTTLPYSLVYSYDDTDNFSGTATATTYNNVNLYTENTFDVIRDIDAPATTDDWTDNWTFAATVTVTLTPTDASGSGIQDTLYCTDTDNTCTPGTSGTSITFTCADFTVCTNYVRYYSTDNVNNTEAINSERVRQDRMIPAAGTVTPVNSDSGTHVDAAFDLSTAFTSDGSDIISCDYCQSADGTCDTEWASATFSAPGTVSGDCSVTGLTCVDTATMTLNMRAVNSLGNPGSGTEISRTCDNVLPATTDNWADANWSDTTPLTVTLTPADTGGSGVQDTFYCIDIDNTCTPSTSGAAPLVTCAADTVCTQYLRYFSRDNVDNDEVVNSQRVRQDIKDPTSTIDTPADSEIIDGSTTITGSATDDNFLEYAVYYGAGENPASWGTIVATSTTPVTSGTFATWDTSEIFGTYTILLRVADQAGNVADDTKTVALFTSLIASGTIQPDQWSMLSIPGIPVNSDPTSYVDHDDFIMLRWDEDLPELDRILKYKQTFSVSAGTGFWVKPYVTGADYTVHSWVLDTTRSYEISMDLGWNQIGTPFNRNFAWSQVEFHQDGAANPVSMQDAVTQSLIDSAFFGYENGGYVENDINSELVPSIGYFIKTFVAGSLVFDPGAGMPGGMAKIVRPAYEWCLQIAAESGDIRDTDNYAGEMIGASAGIGAEDVSEPPGVEPYISVAFTGDAPDRFADRLASDIQPADSATKTWSFTVETSEPGRSVTLSWPNAAEIPDHYEILITDTETGAAMNPKELPGFSFSSGENGSRIFEISARRTAAAPSTASLKTTISPGWNLVSVPLEPYETNILDQLVKLIDVATIFQYYDGEYYTPDSVEGVDIQAGISYWVYTEAEAELEFTGTVVDETSVLDVPLKQGFNFIGVPFQSGLTLGDNITVAGEGGELPLSGAADAGIIDGRLYSYDVPSQEYTAIEMGGIMNAWKGYVIFAHEACTLKLKK
ncbi:FG-GAP-like repeat-containing protein [bacterium]